MKKRGFVLAGLLGLALGAGSLPAMAAEEEMVVYDLDDLGVSVSLPESFVTAYKEHQEDELKIEGVSLFDVDFESLGLPETMKELIEEEDLESVWLMGIGVEYNGSVNLVATDGLAENAAAIDSELLEEMAPQLIEQLEEYGMEDVTMEVYENAQGLSMYCIHNTIAAEDFQTYNIQYQYFGADHNFTITYAKYEEPTEEDEALVQAVADSLRIKEAAVSEE
jgi:hypothetical protein